MKDYNYFAFLVKFAKASKKTRWLGWWH